LDRDLKREKKGKIGIELPNIPNCEEGFQREMVYHTFLGLWEQGKLHRRTPRFQT
jgi:hypothetical protein